MNSRERVLAALAHRQPDRPPRDLGGTIATGIHPKAYAALKQHLGLGSGFDLLAARGQLARVEPAILDRFAIDVLPLIADSAAEEPELDADRAYVDRWGVERRLPKQDGHYYVSKPPLAAAQTQGDLAAFPWPEPQLDFSGLRGQARRLRETTDKALVLNLEVGFLHQAQFMRGYDNWLIDLVADPGFAAALLDRILEIWLAEARAAMAAVQDYADVVIYADDIAFQNGPLASPRVFQRLLWPRQQQVFDAMKASGMAVLYHSCGNVEPLLGKLVDMGVDALNPIQVSAGAMGDTAALKRKWGKHLAFWGGIDTQHVLPGGSSADVRQEVWRRLDDLAAGGGYVLAAVHDIQPDVPPENVEALFRAAEAWQAARL